MLRNASRRRRRPKEAVVDRLSDLPDCILQQILSYLGTTEAAFRTSLLSRRWAHLWKDADTIDIRNPSFHLVAHKITPHYRRDYVTTLRLEGSFLHPAGKITDLGFARLTTLELRRCNIVADSRGSGDDPFDGGLPCLSDLKLIDCNHYESGLAVSGLELLNLEIRCERRRRDFRISRVSAPKLESFHLSAPMDAISRLVEARLPSLVRAVVRLECRPDELYYLVRGLAPRGLDFETVKPGFVTLLRSLHNAKSLDLRISDKFPNRKVPVLA